MSKFTVPYSIFYSKTAVKNATLYIQDTDTFDFSAHFGNCVSVSSSWKDSFSCDCNPDLFNSHALHNWW